MDVFGLLSPEGERALELLAAARDEARRRLDLEFNRFVQLVGRLGVDLTADPHLALEDERLRARAGVGEPPLHQQHVQPLLHFDALPFSPSRKLSLRTFSRGMLCVTPGLISMVTPSAPLLMSTPL